MRFAYADPPYPGQARKHYSADPRCAEVDHAALIAQLCREYPDGWALSTSSVALRGVLVLCPADVRVGAWAKPFASFKPGVNPAYTWEPMLFRGGRKRPRTEPTIKDHIIEVDPCVIENITLKKGLAGAKPPRVCRWIIDVLGARPGDEFDDLFPGTGAFGIEWDRTRAASVAAGKEE